MKTGPNHALQQTAPCVTAPASAAAFPPTMQVPCRTPRSLSLGSICRIACFVLAIMIGVAISTAAELTKAEALICQVLATGIGSADLTLILPEHKQGVMQRLREIAAKKSGDIMLGTVSVHTMAADLLLLRLGDDFTIERMMGDYRTYDSMASWSYVTKEFERSRQPKIIPYLAEDFYSQEDPNTGINVTPPPDSGDFAVSVPARSTFSGVIATRIIAKAPEFRPEMKAWAEQAYALRIQSADRFRNLLRAWWEVNKAAFARQDYQAVVPLTEEEASKVASPAPAPKPEPPTPQVPPPDPPARPEPIPQTPSTPAEYQAPVWPWLVGTAALAIIALLFKKRRDGC